VLSSTQGLELALKRDGIGLGARHIARTSQFARMNMLKPLRVQVPSE